MRHGWFGRAGRVALALLCPLACEEYGRNSGVTSAADQRHADAAVASSRASAAPKPGDDPASCIERPSPVPNATAAETRARFTEALTGSADCTRTLTTPGTIGLLFEYWGDGNPARLRIAQATVDDCEAIACLKRRLAATRLPELPEKSRLQGRVDLALSPRAPPRELKDFDWDRAKKSSRCADPREEDDSANESLPPEQIQAIVRAHYDRIRLCYDAGLLRDPALKGKVMIHFRIGLDGKVTSASIAENQLTSCRVAGCIRDAFKRGEFPRPSGGVVNVNYPIVLEPG
jgi:hypothetical protein